MKDIKIDELGLMEVYMLLSNSDGEVTRHLSALNLKDIDITYYREVQNKYTLVETNFFSCVIDIPFENFDSLYRDFMTVGKHVY